LGCDRRIGLSWARRHLIVKRIIICLDGTGNEVKPNSLTNVFKISKLADLRDPAEQVSDPPAKQVMYYGPGVGTLPEPNARGKLERWASKVIGGSALGHGMRRDIGEAYTYLMNTYELGDKVYVFGFSRGAYTARALCGMLYRVGLMRPGSENLIPYALRVYARRPGADSDLALPGGFDLMDEFAEGLSRTNAEGGLSFPITFLGLFDTVKGTGIIGPDITWAYTNQLPNVTRIAHAVSIDENRKPFRQCLVAQPPAGSARRVDEVWFAGIHSDIGGSFDDRPGLGKITMRWVLDAAIEEGLRIRPIRYANKYTLEESDAVQEKNVNTGRIWDLTGHADRAIPVGARVHVSVRTRSQDPERGYSPDLPDGVAWEGDEQWWRPPPA
jgi:uncharacterized protein (DUF2235 family)